MYILLQILFSFHQQIPVLVLSSCSVYILGPCFLKLVPIQFALWDLSVLLFRTCLFSPLRACLFSSSQTLSLFLLLWLCSLYLICNLGLCSFQLFLSLCLLSVCCLFLTLSSSKHAIFWHVCVVSLSLNCKLKKFIFATAKWLS